MYCTECGIQITGKFCSHCGTPVDASVNRRQEQRRQEEQTSHEHPHQETEAVPGDWEQSVDYAVVSQVPLVRDALARAAAASRTRMTGEDFLELMDKVLQPITIVPTSLIAKLAQPVNDRLGIKTGKHQSASTPLPPGRALAAVLCALAEQGCELVDVGQQSDRCTLKAKIPSDLLSLSGGEFEVGVVREKIGSSVVGDATIKGQFYDWGKCRRRLDDLFAAVRRAA